MSAVQDTELVWPPKLVVAGIEIGVDRLDDTIGTIWLFDRSGRRIAEVLDVAKIKIGCTAPPGYASAD